jgi:glycine/D-amino acid oxidase-like deaminating enzyme
MDTVYDVIVCGGGVAGIAASLSAARAGVKTCLVEKEYAPGGLATLGLIVIYLPLDDGDGVKMSGGIAEELVKAAIKYGPGNIPPVWADDTKTAQERVGIRYQVRYEAAPFYDLG